jgi:hypothetical protein
MAIVGTDPAPRCTPEEWAEFLGMVRHGMLFEVIKWLDAGKPSLRPLGKITSAFESAILAPNLSMTQILWERAWQEEREVNGALHSLAFCNRSNVVMRYLLEAGCPTGELAGYDLCITHDLDLIRLGVRRGVDILQPDGWADAFVEVGSRPLIRFYLEHRDLIPGLRRDAVYAMCKAIKESRLRAIALLKWAGVDPLGKAPEYECWDDPEEEWNWFPALYLFYSKKPDEILKLLKLKPTVTQWFELVSTLSHGKGEAIEATLNIMPDPMAVMRNHPAESGKMLSKLLKNICSRWSWSHQGDERLADLSLEILDQGVRIRWTNLDEINYFRRDIYRTNKKKLILRVLRRAVELTEPHEREDLLFLINKPKMRDHTLEHEPKIMELLGLLPASKPVSRSQCQRTNARSTVRGSGSQPLYVKPHEIKWPGCKVLHRKQIHAEVWAEAAMHVATRYGISGSMLARICTKLQIPRPPCGYWARSKAWKEKHRKSLPEWKGEGADYWVVNPKNVRGQRSRRAK